MNYFTKLFVIMFIAGAFILSSCQRQSALMGEVIKLNNISEIAEKIKNDKDMTKEEIDLFNSGLLRLSVNKDSLANKTVGQIIETQKEFMKKASTDNLTINTNQIEMTNAMNVMFLTKLKLEKDTLNLDGSVLTVKNNTDKQINNVKGYIRIVNSQNQIVKIKPVDWQNFNLKPGEQKTLREFWIHDPKNQNDIIMRETPNLIGNWLPETIVFADGKKLSTLLPPVVKQ